MEVLDFMNTHKDWEDILIQPPYSIIVKHDGNYVLLKYSQLNSDFNNKIVRECRGAIFYKLPKGVGYICVCRAFDKFGNYSEGYVPDIDWDSAVVEEKVDGSLIKFFFHNNRWHIATNGTIDAFNATIGDDDTNFGDLVYEALGGKDRFKEFTHLLDKNWTYMFELVSPKSRVTIFYPETKLYYLGERNRFSMRENKRYQDFMQDYGVLCPKEFNLHSLDDCLEYVKTMTKDEEGFVIRDGNFNRIKLKSPEYLLAFHMDNNGVVTTRRIVEMIKNEQIDDFLAYCPKYKDAVDDVLKRIHIIAVCMEMEWAVASSYRNYDRKEFVKLFKDYKYNDFLFMKLDNPELNAIDYLMTKWTKTIVKMINEVNEGA